MNASSGSALKPTRISMRREVSRLPCGLCRRSRSPSRSSTTCARSTSSRRAANRVGVTALARAQEVSAASASAMVKKLAALGLAEHPPYRGISLTPAGERVALEVIRHHRLLELYLAETLGVARRRRPRGGRQARARDLGRARSADRQGARLPDARSARGSDPRREPRVARAARARPSGRRTRPRAASGTPRA